MSLSFSANCGSFDSLNVRMRWGASWWASRMRCTERKLTPAAFASIRPVQWVASPGGADSAKSDGSEHAAHQALAKAVQMTEAFTIGSEELAILCDFVGGWGAKWATNNLDREKRQALDQLIANGFLEPAAHSITKYQRTAKTELLFAQLCVGISGG